MNQHNNTHDSVLATLRAVVPRRRLRYSESLQIAELQANRLLELFAIDGPTVPSELITELPRIEVRYQHDLPISGSTHWEGGRWIITLNADEPYVRRRFSLMHEFKHVLDHNHKPYLYGDTNTDERAARRAERAADHFAACLLMPKRWLKSQWFGGGQRLSVVAQRVQVSTRALSLRLWHLGLLADTPRCPTSAAPITTADRDAITYYRYTPRPLEVAA
jgi:Zn-dependent peptidase ImmA (M78 family)